MLSAGHVDAGRQGAHQLRASGQRGSALHPLTGEVDAGLLVRYDEEHEFGTLLLPDMVFDVVRVRAGGDDERNRLPPGVEGWRFVPDSARENPLGRVPLVEFRNQMLPDDLPISDVEQVESMQDAVNVCWAYTLNAPTSRPCLRG